MTNRRCQPFKSKCSDRTDLKAQMKYKVNCESSAAMKVLELSLMSLRVMGICSDRMNKQTNEFLQLSNGISFLVGYFGALIFHSASYIYYKISDMVSTMNALMVFMADFASFGSFLSLGMEMVKIFYRKIQLNGPQSYKYVYYEEADRNDYNFTKHLTLLSYNMMSGNWDSIIHFLPIPYHNNVSTITGYCMPYLVLLYTIYKYNLTMTTGATYVVSCCFYIEACCDEFVQIFNFINEAAVNEQQKSTEINNLHRDSIKFHIQIFK